MGNALIVRKRKKSLQKIQNTKDIPFFSYKDEKDICLVSKCYDGDTIWIVRIIKNKPYRFKCRLSGIDTAEMRTKDEEEKKFAIKTRDYLANLILNQYVWVKFGEFDKYGRLLCNIYLTHKDLKRKKSVNQMLIDNGWAQAYDGGTKVEFKNWNSIKKEPIVKTKGWFIPIY